MHHLAREGIAFQVTNYLANLFFAGEIRRVEAIVIAGRADIPYRGQYVKSYRLMYSSDGAYFTQYQEMAGTDKVIDNNIMLILPKSYGIVMDSKIYINCIVFFLLLS